MVSRVKKSVASSPVACARRKVRGWCRANTVPESEEFSLGSAVAPGGVVLCQA